jgi:hypothetical protein
MSSKNIYQRFLWFYNKIKEGKYPNTRTLAEGFEITRNVLFSRSLREEKNEKGLLIS